MLANKYLKSGLVASLLSSVIAVNAMAFEGVGREATANEIKAWDIDVRPDFKGLPPGSGTAAEGEEIWLEKCAVCHGDFGDSNEVFSPIAYGNITPEDIERGRVASLTEAGKVRTTLMKVATVSTLWDYINRAMPWNAPKSLETDEVYAVLAYILNLAYIVDYDYELSNETIVDVQNRMPNRHGMTTDHGMWKIDGKPDVDAPRCMKNCDDEIEIESFLPKHAMNAHGNLKDQFRDYGPMPGINTDPDAEIVDSDEPSAATLFAANGCGGCHQVNAKMVGPALKDVSAKYAGRDDAVQYLVGKIHNGGAGVWGSVPMPGMPQVSDNDAERIAQWILSQ